MGVRNFGVPAIWILVSKERPVLLCGMALGPMDSSSPHKESSAGEGPGWYLLTIEPRSGTSLAWI